MNLFQSGDFTLASGQKSTWRIECDALTDADWEGLAAVAKELGLLPAEFGAVYGVPRGGLKFADALRKYATAGSLVVLVADDVFTTGGSINKTIKGLMRIGHVPCLDPSGLVYAVVAFARNPPPEWCKAVFLVGG